MLRHINNFFSIFTPALIPAEYYNSWSDEERFKWLFKTIFDLIGHVNGVDAEIVEQVRLNVDKLVDDGEFKDLIAETLADYTTLFNSQIENLEELKIPWPVENGEVGQVLSLRDVRGVDWVDPVIPDEQATASAVYRWLDQHPEATTTVADGSITSAKLALGAVEVSNLGECVPIRQLAQLVGDRSFSVDGASVTLDFQAVAGVPLLMHIENFVGTQANVYVLGAANPRIQATRSGWYKLTPTASGCIRVYCTSGEQFSITIRPLTALSAYWPIGHSPRIDSVRLADSITPQPRAILASVSALDAVSDWEGYTQPSDSVSFFEPFRVRDPSGRIIYQPKLTWQGAAPSSGTLGILYDKNGIVIRRVTYSTGYDRANGFVTIPEECYFVALQTYSVHGSTAFEIATRRVEWLQDGRSVEESYVIAKDGSGDFTSTIECFKALANNRSEKVIYINHGDYNVYDEMGGASYIASITDPASLNWRDVSVLVPPNSRIVGRGHVRIYWDAPSDVINTPELQALFSPLNVDGSVTVENVTIEGTNCRYTVHDECSGADNNVGAVHVYRNCSFIKRESNISQNVAFGCGYASDTSFVFDNCIISSNYTNTMFFHDWNQSRERATRFTFNNCRIDGAIRFGSALKSAGAYLDSVSFNVCDIAKIVLTSSGSGTPSYPRIAISTLATPPIELNSSGVIEPCPLEQSLVIT